MPTTATTTPAAPAALAPAPLPPADPLVDGAVLWLNQAVLTSGIHLASQVHRYVIDTFFAGNYAEFASPSRSKDTSFGALCRRDDLQLGESTLYRLVRIGEQVQHLSGEVAQALTLTHHRALLPVTDAEQMQTLAQAAVQQDWSVAELAAQVKRLTPSKPGKAGRPPLPEAVKWLGGVARGLAKVPAGGDFAVDFAGMDEASKVRIRAQVKAVQAAVAAMAGVVQA